MIVFRVEILGIAIGLAMVTAGGALLYTGPAALAFAFGVIGSAVMIGSLNRMDAKKRQGR